ncbi:MAG: DMT family transporter [Pseudomonadota bacterium]|nr:DMT family transporter [Pseudomonadota bacterium]
MNTYYYAVAVALVGGAVLPMQSLINARLATFLQGASWAGATSALVSAIVLIILSPFLTGSPAFASTLKSAPIWIWCGGVLGALYLFATVFSIKPLGAAGVVATVVLGQLVGAVLLDTFGILHPAVPLTWQRLLGCALAISGVWLVTQKA